MTLVGRPRGRRAVEDILISILTELLFSSTTLPFRVRWYSGRIIPPIHNNTALTRTPQMLSNDENYRRVRDSSHSLTHARALICRRKQSMSDTFFLIIFLFSCNSKAVRILARLSRETLRNSLTHSYDSARDMSSPPRRNSSRGLLSYSLSLTNTTRLLSRLLSFTLVLT